MAISVMRVREKRCNQCLFSANKVVSDERRDEILEECNEVGNAFECHKATINGEHIVCRGFFDGNCSLVVRLARLLGAVEFTVEDA